MKKERNIFFIGSVSVLFSVVTVSILYFLLIILSPNTLSDLFYKTNEKLIEDDEKLNMIVELCDTHKANMSKVSCIVNYYDNNYNFSLHNETRIRDTTTFLEKGGVCRDFAVNVCTAIKKLNIPCSYVYPEKHVFPLIQISRYSYCMFDDGMWLCR